MEISKTPPRSISLHIQVVFSFEITQTAYTLQKKKKKQSKELKKIQSVFIQFLSISRFSTFPGQLIQCLKHAKIPLFFGSHFTMQAQKLRFCSYTGKCVSTKTRKHIGKSFCQNLLNFLEENVSESKSNTAKFYWVLNGTD